MKYRSKLILDRLIGPPVSLALNAVSIMVGSMLRRDHAVRDLNGRNIVLCKIVGMGSIVEFSPNIRAIKQQYPDAHIVFVTSKSNKGLIDLYPQHIGQQILIDDSSFGKLLVSTFKAIVQLNRMKIDTFINLEVYSFYTTFISLFSLARNRFGYYRKSAAFRKGLDTHLFFFNTKRSIREVYSKPVEQLGVTNIDYDTYLPFTIEERYKASVNQYFSDNKIGRFVILNPNTSDLMPERRWGNDRWRDVIGYILQETDCSILLSGNKAEGRIIDEKYGDLLQLHAGRIFNVGGKFNLSEFIYCLGLASLMVTNDSGPLHFAFVMQTPIVSLWGPTDPGHLSIKSILNKEVYKNVYCSPCLHHTDKPPCNGDNICMKHISSMEVIQNIEALMQLQETGQKQKSLAD